MPEMQIIEWKEIWKDDYLAWICGFANAQGGTLYIGKNDNGETVGLSNSHKLLEDLPNKIRDAMGIIVPVNLHTDGEIYCYLIQRRLLLPQWQYESEINRIGTGELFAP